MSDDDTPSSQSRQGFVPLLVNRKVSLAVVASFKFPDVHLAVTRDLDA